MTKHFELIGNFPGNCSFALHLYLQMCVHMADPSQLSGVCGGYVDKKMVRFHIIKQELNERNFLGLFFYAVFCLNQGTSTQDTDSTVYIMFLTPRK
jgi:hypothetical protein